MPDLRHRDVQNPGRQGDASGRFRRSLHSARHELSSFMSQQLAYVIITPYSLYKSRTGGILTRLITRTGLDLAGLRMFAPSPELVKEYADTIISAQDPQDRKV